MDAYFFIHRGMWIKEGFSTGVFVSFFWKGFSTECFPHSTEGVENKKWKVMKRKSVIVCHCEEGVSPTWQSAYNLVLTFSITSRRTSFMGFLGSAMAVSIFFTALMTVVWSRSNSRPVSGRERLVIFLTRYMAT